MKKIKKNWSNILFYGLIIFFLTPYGRPKLIQGVSFVKSIIGGPSVSKVEDREQISSLGLQLNATINASDINLQQYKGKVIFLNYWATWCPPCKAEMPSIQKLYNDYSEKVAFVFITADDKGKVTKYYNENKFNFPTYSIGSNPAGEINTRTLPTTFVIDKHGRIAAKEVGASNWNSSSVRRMLDALIEE